MAVDGLLLSCKRPGAAAMGTRVLRAEPLRVAGAGGHIFRASLSTHTSTRRRHRTASTPVGMHLKHLKRVFVAFRPGDPTATSARVLLQRLSSDGARRSNPACKVEFAVDETTPKGQAYVDLEFKDDEWRKVLTKGKTVVDIERIITQKGDEMELRAVFKEVSFDPWQTANRLHASPRLAAGEMKH